MPTPASATTPTTCPSPASRPCQRRLERRHLRLPPDEAREAARPGDVEPRAQRPTPSSSKTRSGSRDALDRERPEVAQAEEPADESGSVLREVHRARLGELLHARGEPDGVPLRGVVHAQIVADLADHDLARVDSHADGEVEPALVRRSSLA